MLIHSCEHLDDSLSITFSNNQQIQFDLFWLRDHSTDSSSLNPNTLQRDYPTFSPKNSTQLDKVTLSDKGDKITLCWHEDNVISEFNADFLFNIALPSPPSPSYQTWGSELQTEIPNFEYERVTRCENSFLPVLEAIEKFGLVTFSGMPTDMAATKKLLNQVGYIRATVFGGLWDFSNNEAHSDSAYTSVGIGLHTDGTYTIDPPGLQLLHCLAFDGSGGFNQFADGFKVAQVMKSEDFDAYQTLKDTLVPAHYIEPGIQLRAKHAVIREDSNGLFEQISFNNFDRSPFMLPKDKQKAFYNAYGKFQQFINDPAFQVSFQLQPGRAVWFNNWRVLHARSAFTGFRHLAGGYTNREDYISKMLTLRGQTPWNET